MNKSDKLLADGNSLTIPRSQNQPLVSFVTFEANEYLVLLPDGVLTSKRLGVLSTLIQPREIIHSYTVTAGLQVALYHDERQNNLADYLTTSRLNIQFTLWS